MSRLSDSMIQVRILGEHGRASLAALEAELGSLAAPIMGHAAYLCRSFGDSAESRLFRMPADPFARVGLQKHAETTWFADGLALVITKADAGAFDWRTDAGQAADLEGLAKVAPELPARWLAMFDAREPVRRGRA